MVRRKAGKYERRHQKPAGNRKRGTEHPPREAFRFMGAQVVVAQS